MNNLNNNKYINDKEAFQKGLNLFEQGNLPEAILALEAAVQQNPENAQAWTKLGLAQAENDKDNLAIKALDKAISIDSDNLEALMALAVSHTNEFHMNKAVGALWNWMQKNEKYRIGK